MALGRLHGPAPSPASAAEMARSRDSLARLAEVLRVPVSTFHPVVGDQDEAIAQAADLVTEFAAIDNPAARRTCLAFVRAMASS